MNVHVFLHSYALSQTYAQLTHTCRYMLTQTDLHSHAHSYMYHIHITYAYINTHAHTHIHTCRFVSPTESQFFEVTMKADRSLKYMASMMSVWGNMVIPMSGSILLTSSTTFLSLPLWMDRWKGGGNFGLFPSPFLLLFIGMELNLLMFWAFCHFSSLAFPCDSRHHF